MTNNYTGTAKEIKIDATEKRAHAEKTMNAAREKLAEKMLNLTILQEHINENAQKGFGYYLVKMEDIPINLNETDFANKAVKSLAKAGYKIHWQTRMLMPDDKNNPKGSDLIIKELLIIWDILEYQRIQSKS